MTPLVPLLSQINPVHALNKLTKTPPTKLKATQTTPNLKPHLNNTGKIRRRPYPPNFNRTAAKIIEPETGAST
jgi:hypothetical protein